MAVTSSTLREDVMSITHTSQDTVAQLDRELLVEAAQFVAELVNGL